jgi:chitodextrinase
MRMRRPLSGRALRLLLTIGLGIAGCHFRGCGDTAEPEATTRLPSARSAAAGLRRAKPVQGHAIVSLPTFGNPIPPPEAARPAPRVDEFTFVADAQPQSGGAPLGVSFTVSLHNPPSGLTVVWTFGDDTPTASAASASHVYQNPGDYTAVMTLSGPELQESREFEIRVTEEDFDVDIDADPDIGRAPLTSQFTAVLPAGVDKNATCEWDFGDGGQATGTTVAHTFEQPGTYTTRLVVTRRSTGQHGTTDVEIQVDPPGGQLEDDGYE